jgi:hypothetical protein
MANAKALLTLFFLPADGSVGKAWNKNFPAYVRLRTLGASYVRDRTERRVKMVYMAR